MENMMNIFGKRKQLEPPSLYTYVVQLLCPDGATKKVASYTGPDHDARCLAMAAIQRAWEDLDDCPNCPPIKKRWS